MLTLVTPVLEIWLAVHGSQSPLNSCSASCSVSELKRNCPVSLLYTSTCSPTYLITNIQSPPIIEKLQTEHPTRYKSNWIYYYSFKSPHAGSYLTICTVLTLANQFLMYVAISNVYTCRLWIAPFSEYCIMYFLTSIESLFFLLLLVYLHYH